MSIEKRKKRKKKADGPSDRLQRLLHTLLVSFDHLLDHLAANGAGFTGSQVAVVAIGQVDTHFLGSLHLELVHGFTSLGDVDLVVVLGTHNRLSPFC